MLHHQITVIKSFVFSRKIYNEVIQLATETILDIVLAIDIADDTDIMIIIIMTPSLPIIGKHTL